MADENYGKIRQAPFNRAPDEKSLLPWAQKELVPFLNQARGAVNWLADHLGYVRVVAGDALAVLKDKLVAGTNVTITQTGTASNATLTIAADTSGADANTVAADATDRTAGGSGYLLAKCSSSGNVTPSLDTTSGQRRVRWDVSIPAGVTLTSETPLSDVSGGDPGQYWGYEAAAKRHRHPKEDPAVEGSYLYTATIKDPNDRGQCACAFLGPHFAGGNTPMLVGWNEVATGVLEYPVAGSIPDTWMDGVSSDTSTPGHESSMLGKWVFAYYQGDVSEHGDEEPLQGPYVIDDIGFHWEWVTDHWVGVSTKPRLRRAPGYPSTASFTVGMTFQMQSGNEYGSDFLTYQEASFVLTEGPTYPWDTEYALLTAAQLVTSPASTETADLTCTQSMGGDSPFSQAFLTPAASPGVTSIPAGPQSFQVESITITTAATDGTITLKLRAYIIAADGSTIIGTAFTAESPPLTRNTTTTNLAFDYDLASPISMTSSQRLLLMPLLSTDIDDALVTMSIRVNSTARGTWWKTTMQFATLTMPDWGDIVPRRSATFPYDSVALVGIDEGGAAELDLGEFDIYLVDPGAYQLYLVQMTTPTVEPGTTKRVLLIFTAPSGIESRNPAGADPGYSTLWFNTVGSSSDRIMFDHAYSTAEFVWLPTTSQWLLTGYNATE